MKSIFAAISNPPSYPVRPIRRFSRPDHSLLSLVTGLLDHGTLFMRLTYAIFGQGLQIVSMNELGIKSFLLRFPNEIRVVQAFCVGIAEHLRQLRRSCGGSDHRRTTEFAGAE